MHNANIMQCISGPMECIKLHSISIRLRVPGLCACVRGPARGPLRPRAARVRRPCVRTPPPNQERGIGEGGGKTPGGFQSYVYIISHPHVTPTPKGPYKTGGPPSESHLCKISKIRQKGRAVLVLPVNGRRANPPPLLFFLLFCRIPRTPFIQH